VQKIERKQTDGQTRPIAYCDRSRLSVCLFPLYLLHRLTFEFDILLVCGQRAVLGEGAEGTPPVSRPSNEIFGECNWTFWDENLVIVCWFYVKKTA